MKTDEIRDFLKIATGAKPPAEGLTVREALSRLDALSKDESLPADLLHYLSRRSYVKALEYLDNPDMPHRL